MSVIDIRCHIWRYGLDISEAYAAWRANLLSGKGEPCSGGNPPEHGEKKILTLRMKTA